MQLFMFVSQDVEREQPWREHTRGAHLQGLLHQGEAQETCRLRYIISSMFLDLFMPNSKTNILVK